MKLNIAHAGKDYTLLMDDLTSDVKDIDLSQGQVMIGYHKPIRKIYVEMESRTPMADDFITVEYNSSLGFMEVTGLEDRTANLTGSGFISWDNLDQVKTLENDKDQYWIRLSTFQGGIAQINGINLVLSSDADFGSTKSVFNFLDEDQDSFIGYHQEARNIIIQNLRNADMKILGTNLKTREIDVFDLHEIDSFKQASKNLTLSLIYEDLAKTEEDMYYQKAKRYLERFQNSLGNGLVSIDVNDNGINDDEPFDKEKSVTQLGSIRIQNG